MAKEIMLNKSFIGSWGVDNDANIPHEIINLFKSDNGNIYIYVPPYGGFDTKLHSEIKYVFMTSSWNNDMTEVLYLAKGLTLLHKGGKRANADIRNEQAKYIKDNNVTYGGKYLHEIKMSDVEEETVFYFTFQADEILKPRKKLFLSWKKDTSFENNERIVCELKNKYNYQRQIGYVNGEDYDILESLTEMQIWDKENDKMKKISLKQTINENSISFLRMVHKEYDETIFTNLFYEILNSSSEIIDLFVFNILGIYDTGYKIRREVKTSDGAGRIDLLIENEKNIIVIENKIKSGLNGVDKQNKLTQLTTYINFIEKEMANGRKISCFLLEPNYNDIDITKFDKKRGEEFKKIKYSNIHKFFVDNREKISKTKYGKYIDDIIESLNTHSLTMRDVVEKRFRDAIYSSND